MTLDDLYYWTWPIADNSPTLENTKNFIVTFGVSMRSLQTKRLKHMLHDVDGSRQIVITNVI